MSIIAQIEGIERKGKIMPYTSLNGHMFSFIDKDSRLSLRLPEDIRNSFIEKYKTNLSVQHGRIMKEYVVITNAVLNKPKELLVYFQKSVEYIQTLKPKATKKKK
jgi:hypothetical protein